MLVHTHHSIRVVVKTKEKQPIEHRPNSPGIASTQIEVHHHDSHTHSTETRDVQQEAKDW